jgi:predicted dehydrogenase
MPVPGQTTRPVRLGIIGCGRVLSGPYRPVLDRLLADEAVEITVACDTVAEREAFVRDTFGAKRFTANHREVIEAADVDVVLVLTPPTSHAALVIEALEAGKHVLVEKPVALEMSDAGRVLEAWRAGPGHLVCAPFTTLSPTYRAIEGLVRGGRIGRILTARSIYGWAGPDWGKWFYTGAGGGPLFDLGVYNLTTLTGLLGPVKRIAAVSGIAVPRRTVDGDEIEPDVDDNFQLVLDHGDGVLSTVTTGFTIQALRTPALELYGETGTVQMLGADWQPDGFELWENEVGAWTLYPETDPGWLYADGLGHLVSAIRSGTEPTLQPEHAVHVLEVMLLAKGSGRDGLTRDLTTTFAPPARV